MLLNPSTFLVLSLTTVITSSAIAQNDSEILPGDRWRDCEGCPELIALPPGVFTMGSRESEEYRYDREGPAHQVTISTQFAIGVYEVTRNEYARFVRATQYEPDGGPCWVNVGVDWLEGAGQDWRNLGFPQTGRHPAVCISWNDAAEYVSWLSEQTQLEYRLPSAAEWEYAARGGTSTPWYWGAGSDVQCQYANGADFASQFPWSAQCNDGNATTSLVGSYRPNAFGMHDMLGNAWEWVQDCYQPTYDGAPVDGSAWEHGDCSGRVMRGASWASTPKYLRVAHRAGEAADFRSDYTGFRVARSIYPSGP